MFGLTIRTGGLECIVLGAGNTGQFCHVKILFRSVSSLVTIFNSNVVDC